MLFEESDTVCNAEEILVWGDGGLKSKENLYFLSTLGATWQMKISVFSFPPYHGHSLCDGHFGVGKRRLRRAFAGQPIATIEDVENEFSDMRDTKTFILPEIKKRTYQVQKLSKGICRFFAFLFPSSGVVHCYEHYSLVYKEQPLCTV